MAAEGNKNGFFIREYLLKTRGWHGNYKRWVMIRCGVNSIPWWCHQMETFSALLAICAGNSPVPDEFPAQRPVTWSFDVFSDLRLNKRLSKQSWGWWLETLSHPLWRYHNAAEYGPYHKRLIILRLIVHFLLYLIHPLKGFKHQLSKYIFKWQFRRTPVLLTKGGHKNRWFRARLRYLLC